MNYLFCQFVRILCSIILNPFPHTNNLHQTNLKTFNENLEHRYKWKSNIKWKWTHCGIIRNCSLCAISSLARGFSHFVWCKFLKGICMLEKVKQFGNQYWLKLVWLVFKDKQFILLPSYYIFNNSTFIYRDVPFVISWRSCLLERTPGVFSSVLE